MGRNPKTPRFEAWTRQAVPRARNGTHGESRPGDRSARRLEKAEVRALFGHLRSSEDRAARERLILMHRRFAVYFARKFAGRGIALEDLIQVSAIGLIKAVDRFDPSREVEFTTFAAATIVGELRRHFRDTAWGVHVPRRLRDVNRRTMRSVRRLTQGLGRSPTLAELATHSGTSVPMVMEAMRAGRASWTVSLDTTEIMPTDSGPAVPLSSTIGDDDHGLERVEERVAIGQALAKLPDRERAIIWLGFYENLPQQAISRRLGVSQMHVSRLLHRALSRMNAMMAV